MNKPLTELQQFLGAYFNQNWAEEHSSADEVVNAFLHDSPRETIITVKGEILELINSHVNELDLQKNLLHEQYCYYHYASQWKSGRLWLEHIIEIFNEYLKHKNNRQE